VLPTCAPPALPGASASHSAQQSADNQWPEIAIRARASDEAASPLATLRRDDFSQAYQRELPVLLKCFLDDFDACIAHLRFPLRHRKVIRTTNRLERLLLEERRRTKIIPHAFGERPVLTLMYAAVIRAADWWRGITLGEFERRQLRVIREELHRAHAKRVAPVATPKTTTAARTLPPDR
jgi:transposase-like protein